MNLMDLTVSVMNNSLSIETIFLIIWNLIMFGQNMVIHYQAFISVNLEDIKQVFNIKKIHIFLHSIKMSSPKEIKDLKLIKIIKELKNLDDAIEEINRIEELEIEVIKQFTKIKTQCCRKGKNK